MKYLAYGSNMLTQRLNARVSSAAKPSTVALRGHALLFHKRSNDGSGKCSIVKTDSDDDVIYGVVFDVADEQMSALDKAEGVGQGYRRDEITLMVGRDATKAFVYIAEENYRDNALRPYRWYYDLVLAGAEEHALPAKYVRKLRAVSFIEDTAADRPTRLEALAALNKYAQSKKTSSP